MVPAGLILCVALIAAAVKVHRWRTDGELYRLMQAIPRLYVAIYYAIIVFDIAILHETRTQMSRYGFLLLFVPEVSMAGYKMFLKVQAWTRKK